MLPLCLSHCEGLHFNQQRPGGEQQAGAGSSVGGRQVCGWVPPVEGPLRASTLSSFNSAGGCSPPVLITAHCPPPSAAPQTQA